VIGSDQGQRGGFVLGMVVGLLLGLSLALGVALYITKAPVPFVNKVPQRTAEQDQAETARNRNWDPNAALGSRPASKPMPAASAASAASAAAPAAAPPATGGAVATAAKSARDPAAILAGAPVASAPKSAPPGVDPFVYFIQVGAYTNADEAEQQRAKLALGGWAAKITEREQSGRTVYRVRLGPFEKRQDADATQGKLNEANIQSQLVRVERS
jgi:cell division protein FtsN